MNFKGAQREFIVRGDKHDDRPRTNGFRHAEAVQLRHLHVQKNQVGRVVLNHGHRRASVGTVADDFNFRFQLQQLAQAVARKRFVIHDQRANFFHLDFSVV